MDMKEVWDLFRMVSKHAQADVASSSSGSTCTTPLKQMSDHVYEISNPLGRPPSLELIFFHGLQLETSQQPHLDTWLSRDGSQVWPLWILEHVPEARILTISYDAHEKRADTSGRTDVYVTNENLLHDLINESQIGQTGCPVVLVGHCVGGLVMKQLCVHAKSKLDPTSSTRKTPVRNFLENIKGLFFYATPHLGTRLADMDTPFIKGPLFQDVTTLNTEVARRNEEFRELCKSFGWRSFGIGENNAIKRGKFNGLLVPEASARNNMDDFYTSVGTDHTNVCKPKSTNSSNFIKLLSFLQDIEKKAIRPIHECQGLPEHPVELEIRAWDIQRKLVDGAVLGICGMGGIGKTTLAKKAFNIMSKDFEYTCFLDNVKGKDIGTLKETLLGQFHHKGMRPETTLTQWSQLQGKKTLLVMDDVDAEEQLAVLPSGYFKEGNRLIMTSRDREVFKYYDNCIVYSVEFLQYDEAEKLFCKHAFGQDPIPDNLRKHVKEIVKKCDGLPLSLAMMGRYLHGRTSEVGLWKETFSKLENATPIHGNDKVWHVLKVSYDGLDKEEQDLFLEAATMFFEEPLDKALTVWGNVLIVWENLVSKSFVKEVTKTKSDSYNHGEYEEYKEVWIHEQLRDLARSILGKDTVCHGSGGGVNPILNKLNTDEMETTTKSLKLSSPYGEDPTPTLRLDSLLRLEHLKYLSLEYVNIDGRGKAMASRLPLKYIPRKLSFVEKGLAKLGFSPMRMDNLVILDLNGCEIPKVLVQALGNFTNLRILLLRCDVQGFERLPENFGNLSQLRRLDLRIFGTISLSLVLPTSFGNLRSLEHLVLFGMGFSKLPECVANLSSLLKLEIFYCDRLASLPDSFGRNLTSLKELFISGSAIKRLPRNFSKLARLERLRLDDCEKLEDLGDSFGDLVSLQKLILKNVGVRKLPASFGDLSSLEKCDLTCDKLQNLSNDFGHLTALKELRISSDTLETLPKNFGRLSSLETCILYCQALKSLSDDFGHLTALKKLQINRAVLETLPENFGGLSSLEECLLQSEALKSLSGDFGHLTALKKLEIQYGDALETLPENFGGLSSLEECELDCSALRSLSEDFGHLTALKKLQMKCTALETLPQNFGRLSSLEECKLRCPALKSLSDDFGHLTALKKLQVESSALETLPENFGSLSSLEECVLQCEALKSLPDDFGRLTALKKLQIEWSKALETLPEDFVRLSSLEKCVLSCSALKSLPEDFGHLTALKKLEIRCAALETLPKNFCSLKSLEVLRLECLAVLKQLPDKLGLIISLRKVCLEKCEKLESVPDSLGQPTSSKLGMLSIGATAALRRLSTVFLYVEDCPYLTDPVLGNLSWGWVDIGEEDPDRFYIRRANVVHNGVKCDGCKIWAVEGPRYKSSTRSDYNLCHRCFENTGSDASDYTCIIRPAMPDYHPLRQCDECRMYLSERLRYKSSTTVDCVLCHDCFQKSGGNASEYHCFSHRDFICDRCQKVTPLRESWSDRLCRDCDD